MTVRSLVEIAKYIGATIEGNNADINIIGIAPLASACKQQLSFLDNPRYRHHLEATKASAVILTFEDAKHYTGTALIVDNPYVAYAKAANLFEQTWPLTPGVHPSAVVDDTAQVAKTAVIGANCVVESGVVIDEHAVIDPGCVISHESKVGRHTRLYANVTVYHNVMIGERCLIHSGVVLGSDGFGMAKDDGNWVKVPQLGGVTIGNDVEIGANTVIDRGALDDTSIGNDVKLDNLIQVAHNVAIGDHTAIAGCTAIAGSTSIGEDCLIGGGVCINGHIQITDNVAITGMSSVHASISTPGVYSSGLELQPSIEAKRNAVRYKRLNQMAQRLSKVEKAIANFQENNDSSTGAN